MNKMRRKQQFEKGKFKIFVLALLVATFAVQCTNPQPKPAAWNASKWAAEQLTPYENGTSARSAEPPKDPIELFFFLYNQKNYAEAVAAYGNLPTQTQQDVAIQFFEANALIGIGKQPEAWAIFETIMHKKSGFHTESKWYLGVMAMKEGNTGLARSLFAEVKNSGNQKLAPEASKVLSALEK
jgi:outer membrane PBP1 activator LpoA protein